jgi:hypothetical protein
MRLFCIFGMLCIVSGCGIFGRTDRPEPIRYVSFDLAYQIASADHIVVTNNPIEKRDSPDVASYSQTITGLEMEEIIHAISSLETPINNHVVDMPESCKWQLKFYRGTTLLGTAYLAKDSVVDGTWSWVTFSDRLYGGGYEYSAPRTLKELYQRITQESQARSR